MKSPHIDTERFQSQTEWFVYPFKNSQAKRKVCEIYENVFKLIKLLESI